MLLIGCEAVLSSALVVCRNFTDFSPPAQMRLGIRPLTFLAYQAAAMMTLLYLLVLPPFIIVVVVGHPPAFVLASRVASTSVLVTGAALLAASAIRPTASRPGTQALAALSCTIGLTVCLALIETGASSTLAALAWTFGTAAGVIGVCVALEWASYR
jgi:hypothetical protein